MKPTKIYTLGDYYNDEGLRYFCHEIKHHRNIELISNYLFETFKKDIPENSIIIPVPFSGLSLVYAFKSEFSIMDPFVKCSFISAYALKKKGEELTPDKIGLIVTTFFDMSRLDGHNIILVDNVIDTGSTMAKCIELLQRPCEAMCVAVNWENYNNHNF